MVIEVCPLEPLTSNSILYVRINGLRHGHTQENSEIILRTSLNFKLFNQKNLHFYRISVFGPEKLHHEKSNCNVDFCQQPILDLVDILVDQEIIAHPDLHKNLLDHLKSTVLSNQIR